MTGTVVYRTEAHSGDPNVYLKSQHVRRAGNGYLHRDALYI